MESEVREDVRIAPAVKVGDLAGTQIHLQATTAFLRRHGGTESVEFHRARARQALQRPRWLARDDGREAAQDAQVRFESDRIKIERCELDQGVDELSFGAFRREAKRGLEGGMKAVAAGLLRERAPARCIDLQPVRRINVPACVAIVADDRAAKTMQ